MEEIDLKQIDVTTLKPLVMAEVPEVEDFFDITVTLAASPSNFTVSFFKITNTNIFKHAKQIDCVFKFN